MDSTKILLEVKERLESVKPNWDDLGSDTPSEVCIKKSIEILKPLLDFKCIPTSIGPSTNGGCTIIYSSRIGRELVIEILNDASVELILIKEGHEVSSFPIQEIDNYVEVVQYFSRICRRGSS